MDKDNTKNKDDINLIRGTQYKFSLSINRLD